MPRCTVQRVSVCVHVRGVWSASVRVSMERESVSVCEILGGVPAVGLALLGFRSIWPVCIPHAPHQALSGHKQSQAQAPACLPSLWSRVVSVQFQGPVTWREGLKDTQGRPWLIRVCWCQGGSPRKSVSTLVTGQ